MKTLEGRATRVTNRTDRDVRASGDPFIRGMVVFHSYGVNFEMAACPIEVASSEPILIGEGDHVVVVGVDRQGVFDALAYRNRSSRTEGNQGWWPALAFGLIAVVMGLVLASMGLRPTPERPLAIAIAGIVLVVGLVVARRGWRVLAARNLLRAYPG